MSDFNKIKILSFSHMKRRLFSTRMAIMLPILILFIPGMAWDFQTQNVLPGDVQPSSATEVMFYTSLGIVFAGTMSGVLYLSMELAEIEQVGSEIKLLSLCPFPSINSHYSRSLVFNSIPTWILWLISFIIVHYRIDDCQAWLMLLSHSLP